MMTDEQMLKAREALKNDRTNKLFKQIMLHRYLADIDAAARWCLPFRMVHDRKYLPNEEPPNDYYGRPEPVIYDGTRQRIVTNPAAVPPITKEEAVFRFTRHLAAVDLDEYGRGDWTGKTITQEEADRLKAMYRDRQNDFVRNPHKYDTQRHPVRRSLYEEMTAPEDGQKGYTDVENNGNGRKDKEA